MNNHRLNSESDGSKQKEFIKKQQQIRAMSKPFVPNKTMNADAMIENLLSNKETFQKKKENIVQTPAAPSWLLPDHSSVSPFYSSLWQLVRLNAGCQGGQLADTAAVSAVLMTSGLPTDTLGFVWSLANRTVPGSLTQTELYCVLALVALAQNGYIFNDISILNQIPQPPIPKLDLSILPQYNMNFSSHSAGTPQHFMQPNLAATDNNTTTNLLDHLDNSSSVIKEPPPSISVLPLDVNKLQGAPVLTLPNYNFGLSYQQAYDPVSLTVGTNQNKIVPTSSSVQNISGIPLYQESVPAIPSISLGLSTPLNLQSPDPNSLVFDNEPSTSADEVKQGSDILSFNNINKFKLDSPTKLPSLSQSSGELSSKLSSLSLNTRSKQLSDGAPPSQQSDDGGFNIDESFDSLSTERASVNTKLPAPNYHLDLFELSEDVQHVFPDSGSSLKLSSAENNLISEQKIASSSVGGQVVEVEDEFTDFQSADSITFNAVLTSIDNNKVTKPAAFVDTLTKSLTIKPSIVKNNHDVNDDDFTNFQEASVPVSDEDLFPIIPFSAAMTVESANAKLDYEKSEANLSEWSDNTSNDWTIGSGGNRSDEKDTDSLNYVDLSDIRLEIPSSDTEEVIKSEQIKSEVIKDQPRQHAEDKYSALRGLQPPNQDSSIGNDDFGDFLAAEPQEYRADVIDSSVQVRCLEACLQILQESYSILSSASSPKVLNEVISDPRTTNHLTCLLEVFRVSERLIKHIDNIDLISQIQSTWNDIVPLLEGSKCYQLENTAGPVCELCKCDNGPFPMKYGRSTFHAPCANLYLHYVDSTLPNSEAY